MEPTHQTFKAKFDELVLEWARLRFIEELCSDFKRAAICDGPWSRQILQILRRQPAKNLPFLAEALPLGVFGQHPDDVARREQLPPKERDAVQAFRDDYDRECRERFKDQVQWVSRRHDKLLGEQFEIATKQGKKMVKEFASDWKWQVTGAGPGEWGLFQQVNGLRKLVSLNLGRDMFLSYHISISSVDGSHGLRFHDAYLGVLGLCKCEWDVPSADLFPEKLLQARDLAKWHIQEYDKLLEAVLNEDAPTT